MAISFSGKEFQECFRGVYAKKDVDFYDAKNGVFYICTKTLTKNPAIYLDAIRFAPKHAQMDFFIKCETFVKEIALIKKVKRLNKAVAESAICETFKEMLFVNFKLRAQQMDKHSYFTSGSGANLLRAAKKEMSDMTQTILTSDEFNSYQKDLILLNMKLFTESTEETNIKTQTLIFPD